MRRALLAATLLAAASPAAAQVSPNGIGLGPSPRWGSFDVGVLRYKPNVDAGLGGTPWQDTFGKSYGWMLQAALWKSIFTGAASGSLEVGFRSGYFQRSGHALAKDASGAWVPTSADTAFKIVPTSAGLQYRADQLVERFGIPFAVYGRVMFERYNWWVTSPTGSWSVKGATNGWSATGGIAFLLDVLDPTLAREFDRDSGVNHTYLFLEITKAKIDDFGSSRSWDLSPKDPALAAGLTLVF
ncbi:MAG TPA: MXAN_2562 family outer membrane beta-barrel protein [Anaeromyxobacter sp.]